MLFVIFVFIALFLTIYFGSIFLADIEDFHDEERRKNKNERL